MDHVICLLHVYPTIYIDFNLMSFIVFEKKYLMNNWQPSNAFIGYSD